MRKTLILVVSVTIFLAGIVGYILGTTPEIITGKKNLDLTDTKTLTDSQNSTAATVNKTESGSFPPIESLLLTAETSPLPLSLRAGIFFEESLANTSAETISQYGYPAVAQPFKSDDQSILFVVVLAPFKTEASLQLAKYELFKKHDIVTRRIITPVNNETAQVD